MKVDSGNVEGGAEGGGEGEEKEMSNDRPYVESNKKRMLIPCKKNIKVEQNLILILKKIRC